MPKCKVILEPVQTKDRVYVNGETLIDDETTIAALVSAGVVVRLEDDATPEAETVVEISETVEQQPTRRRRQQTGDVVEEVA